VQLPITIITTVYYFLTVTCLHY